MSDCVDLTISSDEATEYSDDEYVANKKCLYGGYDQFKLQLHDNADYYDLIGVNPRISMKKLKEKCWIIERALNVTRGFGNKMDNDYEFKMSQQWTDYQYLMKIITDEKKRKTYDAVRLKHAKRIRGKWTVKIYFLLR